MRAQISAEMSEQPLLRELHRAYLDATRKYTGKGVRLGYSDFHQQISGQIETIRKKSGCKSVEFRLLWDGSRVRLRAKKAQASEAERASQESSS